MYGSGFLTDLRGLVTDSCALVVVTTVSVVVAEGIVAAMAVGVV